MNSGTHLERILGRIDDLDSTNLSVLVQRLARERGLLSTVLNVIREGVLVINERGRIEYANAAARSLVGLKEEDIGRAVLWKYVPDLARTLNVNIEGVNVALPTISRELELNYPERCFVRFHMTPFEGTSGKAEAQYAVILSDITEEKLSTEELIENEKISSIMMLAAGVAHELGNPLNSINIHLQLIRRQIAKLEEILAREKIDKAVNVCSNEVERLDGIVKHFLEAIKPSNPNFDDLDLMEVLEEVLEFVSQELQDGGLKAEIILGEKRLPRVSADRDQIKQVFFNIVKNAMEAMNDGGALKMSAHADDDDVYLLFADTGAGIDQESMARLFQPYFSTKKGGHGLGMMICQRIMREHGGKIGIDSHKGKGTVVSLQFPRKNKKVKLLETSDHI